MLLTTVVFSIRLVKGYIPMQRKERGGGEPGYMCKIKSDGESSSEGSIYKESQMEGR